MHTKASFFNPKKIPVEMVLLVLFVFLGAFLFFFGIGAESLWRDEVHSISVSSLDFFSVVREAAAGQHPPLYFVCLHFWAAVFGYGEFALRSLSALFGIGSVVLIYFVGSSIFDKKVGLISSFLCAISPFIIAYSQEARPYAMLLFFSLLSFYFLVKILKNNKTWYYPCYLLANLLMIYTHFYGLFIIISQVLFFLLFWSRYRPQRFKFLAVQLFTIIGLVPLGLLLGSVTLSMIQGEFWIPEPSLLNICGTIWDFTGRNYLLVIFMFLLVIAPFSIRMIRGGWIWKKPLESLESIGWQVKLADISEILLLLIWFLFSIIIAFIISKVTTPIYFTRYLIGTAPALYILVAKGLSRINTRFIACLLLIVIVVGMTPTLVNHYQNPQKEQWRDVARLIENSSLEKDVIMISREYCRYPFEYYYTGNSPIIGIDGKSGDQELDALIKTAAEGKERLWLVLCLSPPRIENRFTEIFGARSMLLENRYIGIRVRLYELAK